MKRKAVIVFAVSAAALILGGCSASSTTISSELTEVDPWEEVSTIEAAEEMVGFEINTPDMSEYGSEESYSVCAALSELQIAYDEALTTYIRKAEDDGDISGDYEEYAYEEEIEVNGNTVTLKGESEAEVILAVWNDDDYAYCVRIADGVSSDTMSALVGEVY